MMDSDDEESAWKKSTLYLVNALCSAAFSLGICFTFVGEI